jgi:ComF family protein
MNILDILFPKSCTICSKNGEYLCSRCKKLFKKTLPECYKCRRISPQYITHERCKEKFTLDSVIVLWEYNELSSVILKKYKYGSVYDAENTLLEFTKERLQEFTLNKENKNSLTIPVPISTNRLRERGFNQTEELAKVVSNTLGSMFDSSIVKKKGGDDIHQSLLDKEEREKHRSNFYIDDTDKLKDIKEIIIVDDVITTGSTLEQISKVIKKVDNNISVKAVCLFRGRAYYKKETKQT